MDSEFGNEQGGDAGGWDGNEGGVNNDGGARVGDEDDLENMIRALGARDFTKEPESSRNFGKGDKHRRGLCMVLKRAVRHIRYCYVLYLSYSS